MMGLDVILLFTGRTRKRKRDMETFALFILSICDSLWVSQKCFCTDGFSVISTVVCQQKGWEQERKSRFYGWETYILERHILIYLRERNGREKLIYTCIYTYIKEREGENWWVDFRQNYTLIHNKNPSPSSLMEVRQVFIGCCALFRRG